MNVHDFSSHLIIIALKKKIIAPPGCHPKNVYATISFDLFNRTEISIYFSLELKDASVTRLLLSITLRLAHFSRYRAARLFTEWKTSQSREDITNELMDMTEHVPYNNMGLIIQIVLVLLRILNDKNSFRAVKWLAWRIMCAPTF